MRLGENNDALSGYIKDSHGLSEFTIIFRDKVFEQVRERGNLRDDIYSVEKFIEECHDTYYPSMVDFKKDAGHSMRDWMDKNECKDRETVEQ